MTNKKLENIVRKLEKKMIEDSFRRAKKEGETWQTVLLAHASDPERKCHIYAMGLEKILPVSPNAPNGDHRYLVNLYYVKKGKGPKLMYNFENFVGDEPDVSVKIKFHKDFPKECYTENGMYWFMYKHPEKKEISGFEVEIRRNKLCLSMGKTKRLSSSNYNGHESHTAAISCEGDGLGETKAMGWDDLADAPELIRNLPMGMVISQAGI